MNLGWMTYKSPEWLCFPFTALLSRHPAFLFFDSGWMSPVFPGMNASIPGSFRGIQPFFFYDLGWMSPVLPGMKLGISGSFSGIQPFFVSYRELMNKHGLECPTIDSVPRPSPIIRDFFARRVVQLQRLCNGFQCVAPAAIELVRE